MNVQTQTKINRLSVIVAILLIAFGVSIMIPPRVLALNIQLFQMLVSFPIDLNFISNLLTGLLAATGMAWFLQLHPGVTGNATIVQHAIVPAITAFILNLALRSISNNFGWWVILLIGGSILFLIILAEYSVVDPLDIWHPLASAGLLSLSYILFLILLSAIAFSGQRLFVIGATVLPVATLLSYRSLQLRTVQWAFQWSLGIGYISTVFALVFHYWPLAPTQYAVILLGVIYSLTEYAQNCLEGDRVLQAVKSPLLALVIFILVGVLVR